MTVKAIINLIESWATPGAAWEKDNIGLQVGSVKRKISNVFLCLELTEKALDEALKKEANFIFTHHPFIFKPLKNIDTTSDPKSRIIEKLIKNDITLFSAHTNLDFTKKGVSFVLADKLKLKEQDFLVNKKSNQYKIVVFIPQQNVEELSEAIFNAGGGIIGEYESCSFKLNGKGTFKGSSNSNPAIGIKGNFESVEEVRLEIIVDSWNLGRVKRAILKSHPYEEPAYDIYPLENENRNYGYGVIGKLEKNLSQNNFLDYIAKSLKIKNFRYTNGKRKNIKTVAVCGGSGSDLLSAAIKKGADAYITADIKYHTFQDGENRILFVDAGHYETEIFILDKVKEKIENYINENGKSCKVFKFTGSTNPIKFYK
ncbi:MAG: Nif3-like dinuclear metal center hexameric protein [Ignavibacteriae bacterium]|nr:MAG: Nif3-like dinuclear metal center hexameric protein [Ignavibacteriota bacterium]